MEDFTVTKDTEDWLAAIPQRIEPEFVMPSPDEPICLAKGRFDLLRDGQILGHIEGEVTIDWIPKLLILCSGESDITFAEAADVRPLHLHVPQIDLTTEIYIQETTWGRRNKIQASLMGAENPNIQNIQGFRFYLVNFPFFLGESVRSKSRACLDRLTMTTGPWVCTLDRIEQTRDLEVSKPGYLLTHVAEVKKSGTSISTSEVQEILGTLYWFFAFLRGARTGPILPSVDSPFTKHWISVAPWIVDEARRVDSWLPDRSSVNVDALFGGFIDKWSDPIWNEALRTTIAWYISANAPSTTHEAGITLCQIALEVLASLKGFEGGKAHERIRSLLQSLNIPLQIPARLQALYNYAKGLNVDAPECITQIRNKLEHPTAKNRKHVGIIDGVTRMQTAQYGLELLELCLLAIMNYRGKYTRRAFQGWKGDDEILVPWV